MIDKLGGDFVRFTTAQISRVFFERVNQEFLRSSSNAPLSQMSLHAAMATVGLSFAAASTTLLRAKMEQEEFEEGSHTSRLLVHDALSHKQAAALKHYTISKTQATGQNSLHAALELGSRAAGQDAVMITQARKIPSRDKILEELFFEMGRLPLFFDTLTLEDLLQRQQAHRYFLETAASESRPAGAAVPQLIAMPTSTPPPSSLLIVSPPPCIPLPSVSSPQRLKLAWKPADKLALMVAISLHGNSWRKMATEAMASFSPAFSNLPPKILASKMKAMASSPSFSAFKIANQQHAVQMSSPAARLPLPALLYN